jgi:membrane associated rhomboid family serine protease
MLVPEELFFLLINMMGLWAFGRRLEDACGHGRFLLLFFTCGLAANFINTNLFGGEFRLGLSGVFFGLVGAFLVVFPKGRLNLYLWVRMRLFIMRIKMDREFIFSVWWLVIPMLVLQAFLVLVSSASFYLAHFGALLTGAFFVFMFLRPDAFARMRHRVPI